MEDGEYDRNDADQVRSWRQHELQRLRFTRDQRTVLLELMEDGEVELAEVRSLIEKRGWSPEQAFLNVA